MSEKKTAVLLLAYGGPESPGDIPAYLLDIRGGRETPQHLIDEITERYQLIGGRSPLLEITLSAASKLQAQIGLPVYVGMRHWNPLITETVQYMVGDGVQHAVVICMAPHYSTMSIGAYRKKLEEALAQTDRPFSFEFVESWHTQADYLNGIAANVQQSLKRFPVDERVLVVFSAHSLPESILESCDPYDRQLRETAHLLADKLNLPDDRWTFSYQSAAKTGVPWLGPQIEDLVAELAQKGEKNLLIAPVGFIADHVEVLYDLDIGVQKIAQQHGLRVERTPMLNDTQPLIDALVDLARVHTGREV
jgi:ferrochelatase